MLAATESVMRAVDPLRSPAGVVALAPYRPAALEQLDDAWRSGLVIAAVQVQDPGNVGAIIRTVDAGGGAGVVTTDDSADPFGWRALRGAMGSTFRIPVATCPDMQALIRRARGRGAAVVAAVPHGGVAPDRTDLVRPTLALLGAEGGGLDRGLDDTADVRVSIPMRRTVDSLNVAVAAGVLVYEARRQRAAAASGGRA